jgi:hypothetical protein
MPEGVSRRKRDISGTAAGRKEKDIPYLRLDGIPQNSPVVGKAAGEF